MKAPHPFHVALRRVSSIIRLECCILIYFPPPFLATLHRGLSLLFRQLARKGGGFNNLIHSPQLMFLLAISLCSRCVSVSLSIYLLNIISLFFIHCRPHEVEVAGRRHGVTKRKLATPAARLQISKIELFNRFARTYRRAEREALHNLTVPASVEGATQPNIAAADDVGKLSYADAKARSVAYASQWASVRATMFGRWPVKPTSLGAFLSDAS